MQAETARMLVDAIANALGIAIDNRNKITALEAVFQKRDPSLFQEYVATLDAVRRNPPTVLSELGFANLQSKLVQE